MKRGITIAGTIVVDHHREIDKYPEHSNLVSIRKIYNSVGGIVSNTGISLARLNPDLPLNFIGTIGEDADGDFILDEYSNYPNINIDKIIRTKRQTSFTDVMEDMTENTRTFFNYSGSNDLLGPQHFNFAEINSRIIHVGYMLVMASLDSADEEYGTKMARILHDAQVSGIKTSVDMVTSDPARFSKIVPPALKYTNYCIINEEEAARTVGKEIRNHAGVLDIVAAKDICEDIFAMGVKDWVVIHSREGGIALDSKGNFVTRTSLDINPQDILGTTGAGDAFCAGVLLAAYNEYSLDKAVELGIATSAASLTGHGATSGIKLESEVWELYKNSPKEQWPGFD